MRSRRVHGNHNRVRSGISSVPKGGESGQRSYGLFRRNLDVLVMAGIVILLITGTLARNAVWNSDVNLWMDSTHKSPEKLRPYANLIGALITERRYAEAKGYGLRALQVKGEKPYYLYYNIGNAYHHLRDTKNAYKFARRAVDLQQDTNTMQQLGLILKDMGWKPGMPSPEMLEDNL